MLPRKPDRHGTDTVVPSKMQEPSQQGETSTLNAPQRIVVVIAGLLITACLAYPPWYYYSSGDASFGPSYTYAGRLLLFSPSPPPEPIEFHRPTELVLATPRLATELLVVLIPCFTLAFVLRSRGVARFWPAFVGLGALSACVWLGYSWLQNEEKPATETDRNQQLRQALLSRGMSNILQKIREGKPLSYNEVRGINNNLIDDPVRLEVWRTLKTLERGGSVADTVGNDPSLLEHELDKLKQAVGLTSTDPTKE